MAVAQGRRRTRPRAGMAARAIACFGAQPLHSIAQGHCRIIGRQMAPDLCAVARCDGSTAAGLCDCQHDIYPSYMDFPPRCASHAPHRGAEPPRHRAAMPSEAMPQTNDRRRLAAEPARSFKWTKRRGPRAAVHPRLAPGPWRWALCLQSSWAPVNLTHLQRFGALEHSSPRASRSSPIGAPL